MQHFFLSHYFFNPSMGRIKVSTLFSANNGHHYTLPLVNKPNTHKDHFPSSVLKCFRRFICGRKVDGGSRTKEEEKVYSWLYTLAQSEKNLVFEYVRSTERGLSFTEAERRLRENGPNVPLEYSFPSLWNLLWNALFHPFNMILIILSSLSFIARDYPNGFIMLILVFISVILRFCLEHRSSKAAMKLSEFLRCPIKVQRCAGRIEQKELIVQVDHMDVVPGDIVIFEPGDLFPGDIRLLSSKHLVVSQASLTGESWTTDKAGDVREDHNTPLLDLKNICFMGTNVVSVSSALNPQMLPLIINTCLAKGAVAMAKDRCIVKSLTSIREMGSMDILCIDKTGTLTMNHAILVNHLDCRGLPREKVLRYAFLNSYFKAEQKYPLDDAILAHVYSNGFKFQPSKWKKIDEIPFDFIRRRVSVMLETDDRHSRFFGRFMVTKGALLEVIKVCSFIENFDKDEISTFSSNDYQRILNLTEELSNEGLRVIAVAIKKVEMQQTCETSNGSKRHDYDFERDMIFLGFITFFDPPKDSAKEALWCLAEKGVKAKVLTGDSLSLTTRICREVGISTTHVITGPELEELDQETFHETVKRATVLARLTPSQKLRVVQSLQTKGNHVVGFLGDGVNDSLALDAAHVSISVDSGVAIAKDMADIILLEKDLNVLVAGVEHGRLTFGNTMKYLKMSVIANLGSIISLLIATLFLKYEPLTSRQLLTQNFIYSLGQIVIPWDKMDEEYLNTPHKWSVRGLPMFILWNGPVCILCDVATLLFLWFYCKAYDDMKFFHSAWFIEGLLMQTLIVHLMRTEKIPFIQDIASWPVIFSTLVISTIGIAIPFTPIGRVMGFTLIPLSYFGFLFVIFMGYFTIGQVVKRLYILVYKRWL
ncbi:magnesium-transporting ATPase, P-type 1 isoform X2 [Medicago truncatula]|uniref:magnesium-transporting ATPase, P-type 1 isoform X2 n=1 Tax=Medicago truncatula TaxID=3880 RepID=UPI001967F083|nr:magnesium-transporting ATPase, P-type 1 isoform X2 [Medicago truncatula]